MHGGVIITKKRLFISTVVSITVLILWISFSRLRKTFPTNSDPIESSHVSQPDNSLWIHAAGNLSQRLTVFNNVLAQERANILEAKEYHPWKSLSFPIKVIWANTDDFFDRVKGQSLTTLFLAFAGERFGERWTSLKDTSNLLIDKYYQWTATEPLCRWIETAGYTKARWDAVYNKECTTDISSSQRPRSIEPVYFYGKPINPSHYWPNNGDSYPSYFYTKFPDHILYLHLMEHCVVTANGDVFTNSIKLVPYSCGQDVSPFPPQDYASSPIYSEIFVISGFWGHTFFHMMLENLPRLSPYIQFLKTNPTIKIHVSSESGLILKVFRFLGINPERLVSGVMRGKVVYMPRATPCGFARVQEVQLLSRIYRDVIHSTSTQPVKQSSLILIQRSGTRQFLKGEEIKERMKNIAEKYGFVFELFPDNPSPSWDVSSQMFNRALIVVAPHGAGLSNIIFSEPGTYVIEGVCNPPHVNMCYQWTAHILGHHYHAIPSRQGCESVVDIEPDVIDTVIIEHINLILKSRSN